MKIDEESFLRIESIVVSLKTFKKKEWKIINEIFTSNNKKENAFLVKSISLLRGENIVFHELEASDFLIKINFPFDVSVLYDV